MTEKKFVLNSWLDHLLQVQARNPQAYKALPRSLQVKVGKYGQAKARALEGKSAA